MYRGVGEDNEGVGIGVINLVRVVYDHGSVDGVGGEVGTIFMTSIAFLPRIVGGLAGGMTNEEITREYDIMEEDVRAALAYVAELIDSEEFHPLPVPIGERDEVPR